MSSLTALNGIEDYIGINIREDLTIEQRRSIKTLSKEAAERNIAEKLRGKIWRVRGSVKDGFYLKRIVLDDKN